MDWQRDIEVLTPLFNRGAYQDTPELRVPSIRGQVRWWFRALGGTSDEEKTALGGLNGFGSRLKGEVRASPLVFRVSRFNGRAASPNPLALPHKQGGQGSPQAAFAPGATFHLTVFDRFSSLDSSLQRKVQNALETWLLLGALGLRANRGGGNLWPMHDPVPRSAPDLRARLTELGCRWPAFLAAPEVGESVEQLRAAATDTVNGVDWVFGFARGRDRLASALKFKILRLEGRYRLLITAHDSRVLAEARQALRGHRSKPELWQEV